MVRKIRKKSRKKEGERKSSESKGKKAQDKRAERGGRRRKETNGGIERLKGTYRGCIWNKGNR